MIPERPLRIALIAGEESGDILGADLVASIQRMTGGRPALIGVGGQHLKAHGLETLFDPSAIALMGVTGVLKGLPGLIAKIDRSAKEIIGARPDCLVTIDVPDFSLRVARRVRKALPDLPVIHYVCPSVWAWRPARAPAMREYVDRVLCILPFEEAELARLGGPPGTYVGHRLTQAPEIRAAAAAQRDRPPRVDGARHLLVLPGSRSGEVRSLIADFGEAVRLLAERGNRFTVTIPTIPRLTGLVRAETEGWAVTPSVVTSPEEKAAAFAGADAALAASGTVTLELALSRVPAISCYRLDFIMRRVVGRISVWSSVLPNLIADRPVYPEHYDAFIRPGHLARQIELLWNDTPYRAAQIEGFDLVERVMATEQPAGVLAAEAVLSEISRRK